MRILHILDHSIPLQSSYAFRTQAILKEQRALGWDTVHLTGPKQGPAPPTNEEEVDGWHFYRTPPPGGLLEGVPVLSEIELMGEIAYRIERIVKRVRPHILHAHSPVLNAIPALRVGRRLDIPVLYEVRAFWADTAIGAGEGRKNGFAYRLRRRVETWVLRRVDAVITIHEELRVDMLAHGIQAEKVTVIPNAENIEACAAGSALDVETERGWKASLARYEDVYARILQPART
jgi:glycosyltransferase involved in cell wall biosynthesis